MALMLNTIVRLLSLSGGISLALRRPEGIHQQSPDLSSELSFLSPQGPAERLEEEWDGHLHWSSLCQPHAVEALAGSGPQFWQFLPLFSPHPGPDAGLGFVLGALFHLGELFSW